VLSSHAVSEAIAHAVSLYSPGLHADSFAICTYNRLDR